uniref:Zinc finger protein 654 n=1 Tax=Neogobius melanostomus TaxID=47308 RepID=A0A8C6WFN9_9GOBI
MADSECDLETDGLDLALETLCTTHCKDEASLSSKEYCSAFCELVEEYTGQWQVPLPQLKVLRTALCSFTNATAAFPDDCQHVHFVLSRIRVIILLFFFQPNELCECHTQLLRHRNIYLHHVKLTIKSGGPWENAVLKGILKEEEIPQKEVEEYLSAELPILLELRVRYLQACERLQEAMALSKCCLENQEMGKHLFFHQAYLTCLYKASLHDHLLKEVSLEIDGRDAVEIICNTESVEKDELLLSLCKTFLTQQLHNGDMYYIWDLVFIWSRLYLRAHPSKQEFISECLSLTSSANNVRALFPFIKLVHSEVSQEGIPVCVELCAKALQLCDLLSDGVTRSLVCKTIAFLLPHDLEMCRACALLVFCQERSLEAYRTVCSLYKHPDNELHPNNSPVRTCIRFHILQKLKEHLCFDPEFWNLLTLRTHCLELISDKAMQAAVLSEMEEEEKYCEALAAYNSINELSTEEAECVKPSEHTDSVNGLKDIAHGQKVKPLTETENKYNHIVHSCKLCNKIYRGLNVLRHALSHMKKKRKICILCGQRFKEFSEAGKHVEEHIEEMSQNKSSDENSKVFYENKINKDDEINDNIKMSENCVNDVDKPSDETNDEQPPLSTLLDKGEETESTSEKEVECKEEEKFVCKDLVYYLCPGEGCDKVFFKLGHTMTKHAMKYHLSEERVQEKVFEWTKQKCILCSRHIEFIQHFKGHMKLHVEHPQFFCYHQDCGQRFASTNELRTHESQHLPLRPQCKYPACESVFNNMVGLSDHEWRHYVPTPLKSDFELGPNKHKRHNDEAPWKQRVKQLEIEPIDVKNRTENTILTSECEPSVEEPVIEPHKAFKPAYKSVFKALVRPPPSMYMTESELSMRKRKSGEIESLPVKKYQYTPKKQPSEKPGVTQPKVEPETKIRHRCEKCLSFFTSPEELEKHKSLNTCSALFGFDSDDESK